MSEWISVGDRIPEVKRVDDIHATFEQSDCVLAVGSDRKYSIVRYEIDDDGSKFWTRDDGVGGEITHWMPLPEPPEDIENGN